MAKTKTIEAQIQKNPSSPEVTDLLNNIKSLVGTDDSRIVGTLEPKPGRWKADEVISSGSLQIDLAVGIGGIPRGKVIEIYGQESCGKSTISQLIMANAQRQGLLGLYIDSEHALDPTYAATLGIDLKNMTVFRPENLEQALDLIIGLCKGGFDGLIVLDSIPNTLPKKMMDAEAGEEGRRAAAATVYTRMMPVIKKQISDSNATLFMVNQTRSTMATQPWEKKEDTPGGKMLKYTYDLRLEVRKSLDSGERRSDEGTTFAEISVQCTKNKFGAPYKSGHFILRDSIGIDPFEDAVNAALRPDVGLIFSDWKIEDDGVLTEKKNWFLWLLSDEDGEAIYNATLEVDEDGEAMPNKLISQVDILNEDSGEVKTRWVIRAYNRTPFMNLLEEYQEVLAPILREGVLNTLAKDEDDEEDAENTED